MASDSGEKSFNLNVGDIIEIISPTDDRLDEKMFLIKYVDDSRIIVSGKEVDTYTININQDGSLQNDSITNINLLNRAESPSYAIQNGLLKGQWIDIRFGGDLPTIITGEITSLDEDQIEINLFQTDERIYIDFAFRGIPQDIPIVSIDLRNKPEIKGDEKLSVIPEESKTPEEVSEVAVANPEDFDEPEIDEETLNANNLRDIISTTDQIQIGNKLESLSMLVEVPESEMRYGVDVQTTDLLNELLSIIPSRERSQSVLNNIHRLIERFKQLRNEFSLFDQYGNASKPELNGPLHKPLIDSLQKLNHKLYWILPIVRNTRKLYDIDEDSSLYSTDFKVETLVEARRAETALIDEFKQGTISAGQNGYDHLTKKLSELWTPFINSSSDDTIASIIVKTSIAAVVDNLENYYTSVAKGDNIDRKRFLIQEYNLGFNTLEAHRVAGEGTITRTKQVTVPDQAFVKSFLTLPESAVAFSHINLPSTNMLLKCNLSTNYLSYWRLLNNLTTVKIQPVSNDMIEFDELTYLKNICEYIPTDGKMEYNKYLENIIPKTRVLFDLIKTKLDDKMSVQAVLDYLEPFMIYQRDLSFKQHEEITSFINNKIIGWKRKYINNKEKYNGIYSRATEFSSMHSLFELFARNKSSEKQLLDGYKMDNLDSKNRSSEELIKLFTDVDHGRYFNTIVSMLSSKLMMPEGSFDILKTDEEFERNYQSYLTTKRPDDCEQRLLAKKYNDEDELNGDNNVSVKFDKKYDRTYYDIINEYSSSITGLLTDGDKIDFLTAKLQETIGMTLVNAEREAEALVLNYKPVRDGDYAIVTIDDDVRYFYIRRDNSWVRDESIPEKTQIEDNRLFCNLGDKCISIKNTCDTIDKSAMDIQKSTFNKMVMEFDDSLTATDKKLHASLISLEKDNVARLDHLYRLKLAYLFKNDTKMHNFGLDAKTVDELESPYASLRDLIMAQNDFIKKQNDISKFVSLYTRPATGDESTYWLYCTSTSLKLLPTFVSTLSLIFIQGGDYFTALYEIMARQGSDGGDGDAIIDKHSGWVISNIAFNTEEGFSEDGRVLRTREIMDSDISKTIAQAPIMMDDKPISPEMEKIIKVSNAISNFLGVDISKIEDFVINETSKMIDKRMPSKADYTSALAEAKGKKVVSYETVYNQTLILITASYILIGIQTSIPSIKTHKTYPGCIKSFSGYPIIDNGDKSGIIYVACVVNKLKSSSIDPWNSINTMKPDKIVSKMEGIINRYIFHTDIVKQLVTDKEKYLMEAPEEVVPEELDISNWINFLPPLKPVKITVTAPSKEFKEQLVGDIRKGSKNQFDKINALKSKIIYLSLSIESAIQEVVSSNIKSSGAILSNSSNVAFLENACCNESNIDTYTYFSSKKRNIDIDNNIVRGIRDIIYDITIMSRAPLLFDPSDTRTKYTVINKDISEITIYKAFISYCRYNSKLPINKDIISLCEIKPDEFSISDTIEDKISKLKSIGKNFDNESLSNLMVIINRQNLVKLNLSKIEINNIQKINDTLKTIKEHYPSIFPVEFIDKFLHNIELTWKQKENDTDIPSVREFKNYLDSQGTTILEDINTFVLRNTTHKLRAPFISCIRKLLQFDGETDIHTREQFMKNSLSSLLSVLPNIILNVVNYDSIKIPTCWKLSEVHQTDLKNHAKDHFNELSHFYDNPLLNKILKQFQIMGECILHLSEHTLYIAPLHEADGAMRTIFDKKMVCLLFNFYMLSTFKLLIELVKSDKFYSSTTERPVNAMTGVKDVELSYLQDDATIDEIDGEKQHMSLKISKLITTLVSIVCSDKKTSDMSYDDIMDKVTRSKEKEKDIIVEYLTDLTDSEREIENMFKNFRMGKWSVGIQKGYKKYDSDTYDRERDDIDKRTILENKMKKVDGVTEGLMDMFTMEESARETEADMIESEELSLENVDYGDIGDDNYEDEM